MLEGPENAMQMFMKCMQEITVTVDKLTYRYVAAVRRSSVAWWRLIGLLVCESRATF